MDYPKFSYKIKELFSEYKIKQDDSCLVFDINNKYNLMFWSYSFYIFKDDWKINKSLFEYLNGDNLYETTLDEAIIFKELILPKYL